MSQRSVAIGVTGGVAAYKTATVVSRLAQRDLDVQVVMTTAAEEFVGPATFAALSGRPVARAVFESDRFPLGAHIEIARRCELLCVAPATANFLAQAAHGAAHDLLGTLYLCFQGPVLMAPAMNTEMWENAAVQRNFEQLQQDGVQMVGPGEGWLSCRQRGAGRMAEPESIVDAILATLDKSNP